MKKLSSYVLKIAERFIFSDLCPLCKSDYHIKGKIVCESCLARLKFITEPFCAVCGKPFINKEDISHTCGECLKNERAYDKARAVFVYNDIIRNKIINYKFLRDITLAKFFSEYMLKYIENELNNEYDLIIPVPLHKKRLMERYFNQALLLVKQAPKFNKINVDKHSLVRIKYTLPQLTLKFKDRSGNIKDAFEVKDASNIAGKKILVVDDIYTTGSTVNECSLVLKKAGAIKVDVLTLARVAQNENI